MSLFPRKLPTLLLRKDKKFVEFHLKLEGSPTAMERVLRVLQEHSVGVEEACVYSHPSEMDIGEQRRSLVFEGFLEVTNSSTPLTQLRESLGGISDVYEVRIHPYPIAGLAACRMHFPPTVLGEGCVIFRRSTWGNFLKRLYEKFSSAAYIVMYQAGMGVAASHLSAEELEELYSIDPWMRIRIFIDFSQALGWGRYELVEVDSENLFMRMRMYDHFECEPFRRESSEPKAYFVRGYLQATLEKMFDKEFVVDEVRCIAMGDPYCEIVAKAR